MTRRIVRTVTQAAALLIVILVVVFLLDTRYRLLPHAIHSAFPLHHEGLVLTDVTLTTCSTLNPLSSCRLNPDVWHRVEKDLYLSSGWVSSAYLHVQRKREEELSSGQKVVIGIRVGRLDPGVGENGQQEERWEARPGGIWILRSGKRHDSDSDKAVTGIDVLFGADAAEPRPGWTIAQTPLLLDAGKDVQMARLSMRHGRAKGQPKETAAPRIRNDGKFKILQVSDLHLSTGVGACRDAMDDKGEVTGKCEADPRTLDFVEKLLEVEKPDMVALTGDQVNGDTAPDVQSALFKIVDLLISRSLPYAAIFGNHDDEGPRATHLSRSAQMSLLSTLPFSLAQPGPEEVDGVGNYFVEVLAPSPSQHSAITIYFLDSHSYSPDEASFRGYDWIKPSQIEWFKQTSQGLKVKNSKYSHFHLDMAFIHIPLPEYRMDGGHLAGGDRKEPETAPGFNSGFYAALKEEGVVSVGCGHDHVNDYCALRPKTDEEKDVGPWMCYAGGSGFGGYAGWGGFHRRIRVWEIDTNSGRLSTWTRLECCGKDTEARHNEITIVDGGRVVEAMA